MFYYVFIIIAFTKQNIYNSKSI